MVHSREDYKAAVEASGILFGKSTRKALSTIREDMFLAVFEGVPRYELPSGVLPATIAGMFAEKTDIFASKGELKRLIQGGGLSMNKEKIGDMDKEITRNDLINDKYLLVQKGKKNYYLIIIK